MWPLILLLVLFVSLAYLKFVKPLYYWDERNVPNSRGWPIFGKQLPILLKRLSPQEWLVGNYREFPDARYMGTSQFNRNVLLLRDPKLIKEITVRNFDHFVNRIDIINKKIDPLIGNSLLFQEGHDWKEMRCTLSPAFTSSKMKAMFRLIVDCADDFTDYFYQKGSNTIAVRTKDVATRFANDVIASCAFGVTCNSLKDKNNEFYTQGMSVGFNGFVRIAKVIAYSIFPKLMQYVTIPIFSKRFNHFFKDIITETLQYREKNHVMRPDMINLLMEARKGTLQYDESSTKDAGYAVVEEADLKQQKKYRKNKITDDDIAAQAMLFFFAGFEPASTAMAFLAHELAVNPDIHKRLQAEIEEVYRECNGRYTYEAISGMKYLDMVVSESLRKWPSVPVVHRKCTKEYTIKAERDGERDLHLKVGQSVIVPIVAIHADEKYFPNPEKFDPERFSEVNVSKIQPYAYLPFGMGPRSCIGSRFAILEIKVLFATLLTAFDVVAIEKTPVNMTLRKGHLTMAPVNDFWIGLRPKKQRREPRPYY